MREYDAAINASDVESDVEELTSERKEALHGRCGWLAFGPCLGLFTLRQVWVFVHVACKHENDEARNHTSESDEHEGLEDAEIHHVGARATAALACASLSMCYGALLLIILQTKERTRAPIRASLLMQFLLKGAFLATSLAFAAQLVVIYSAGFLLMHIPFVANLFDRDLTMTELPIPLFLVMCFLQAAMAGLTEEASKLLVVLMCTDSLRASRLREYTWKSTRTCHYCCRCRSVVVSPSAFVLSAVACGLGFMMAENTEYAAGEATSPERTTEAMYFIGVARVLMNLHWVFAGLSAIRYTPYLFAGSGQQPPCGGPCLRAVAWAIWPSACFHALWDITVTGSSWTGSSAYGAGNDTDAHQGGNSTGDAGDHAGDGQISLLKILLTTLVLLALISYFACLVRRLCNQWPDRGSYRHCDPADFTREEDGQEH